jgi:hypothetical protein
MTDTDKSRFVATALGLWSEDTVCTDCDDPQRFHFYGAGFAQLLKPEHRAHPASPPSFLSPAGADLLLRTLLPKFDRAIKFEMGRALTYVCEIETDIYEKELFGTGATWPEALLDAAYRLFKTYDRKTMEGM